MATSPFNIVRAAAAAAAAAANATHVASLQNAGWRVAVIVGSSSQTTTTFAGFSLLLFSLPPVAHFTSYDPSQQGEGKTGIMGVLSKIIDAVRYTRDVVVYASVTVARKLHLPAIIPFQLLGASSNQPEDGDDESFTLGDGDEYVKMVTIEALSGEPNAVEEYIETVKLETVDPKRVEPFSASEPVQEPAGLMSDSSSHSGSSSKLSDESLQPEEEVVEVSDEDDLPVPVSDDADKDIPFAVNVTAPPATNLKQSESSPATPASPSTKEKRSWVTTIEHTAYFPTGDGSMVAASDMTGETSLESVPKRRRTLDGISDSTSGESNETEASEEPQDERIHEIDEDIKNAERADADFDSEMSPSLEELEADSKMPASLIQGGSTSSLSSMISSSSEDENAAIRRELGEAPSFMPPISTNTAHTVVL